MGLAATEPITIKQTKHRHTVDASTTTPNTTPNTLWTPYPTHPLHEAHRPVHETRQAPDPILDRRSLRLAAFGWYWASRAAASGPCSTTPSETSPGRCFLLPAASPTANSTTSVPWPMVWFTACAVVVSVVVVVGLGPVAVPLWDLIYRCGGIALLVAVVVVVVAFVIDGAKVVRAPRTISMRHSVRGGGRVLLTSHDSGPAVLLAGRWMGDAPVSRVGDGETLHKRLYSKRNTHHTIVRFVPNHLYSYIRMFSETPTDPSSPTWSFAHRRVNHCFLWESTSSVAQNKAR